MNWKIAALSIALAAMMLFAFIVAIYAANGGFNG